MIKLTLYCNLLKSRNMFLLFSHQLIFMDRQFIKALCWSRGIPLVLNYVESPISDWCNLFLSIVVCWLVGSKLWYSYKKRRKHEGKNRGRKGGTGRDGGSEGERESRREGFLRVLQKWLVSINRKSKTKGKTAVHYTHSILGAIVIALKIINHFPKVSCFVYETVSLFCLLGHSRPGEIQDHHHSLLSRGHGLHFNVWHHKWRVLQCSTRLVSYCHYKWW